MSSDLELMQALFDTEPMGRAMNWPVGVAEFVTSVRKLRQLCSEESSSPSAIAHAWKTVCAAIGMDAMAALLEHRGEWQRLAYASAGERKPWREHDDFVVLWDQPTGRVVATVKQTGGFVDSLEFNVQAAQKN